MGVHDTDRYTEVKSLLGIPEDEPIFILRAQDRAAPNAVDEYGHMAERIGASEKFCVGVDRCAAEFDAWQVANPQRVKVPD